MSKNIIVCCDGTGNQIDADLSNVLKLYRMLEKDANQIVYYHPGIGTIGSANPWKWLWQKIEYILYRGVGYGLDENIIAAYKFLIDSYEEGDKVFLFGFSRGAYTVRALAAFMNVMGLLRPEQKDLCDYALTAFKQVPLAHSFLDAARFQEITLGRHVPIAFVGVWDTVSSVLAPSPDKFFILSPQKLPYTQRNPSVMTFRQAMAIDERRRMFRLNTWIDQQNFQPNPFDKTSAKPQDIRQVWFSGVHSDVGGGYPEAESGVAKFPLIWMAREAQKFGVRIRQTMFDHLALGQPREGGKNSYVAPDPKGPEHKSLKGGWWVCEVLPKLTKYPEWPRLIKIFGVTVYLPFGERRHIPDDAFIHQSVLDRMKQVADYKPKNLPAKYGVEP